MAWKPGESGNPKGRPRKGQSLSELLRARGDRERAEGVTWKQAMVEKLWELAVKGNLGAIRLIFEYLEGKPREIEPPEEKRPEVLLTDEEIAQVLDQLRKWREAHGLEAGGGAHGALMQREVSVYDGAGPVVGRGQRADCVTISGRRGADWPEGRVEVPALRQAAQDPGLRALLPPAPDAPPGGDRGKDRVPRR